MLSTRNWLLTTARSKGLLTQIEDAFLGGHYKQVQSLGGDALLEADHPLTIFSWRIRYVVLSLC